ncbi:hypothetical protein [Avrilella dinanensis]|uniref:50S ribosomal protein L27 n=1 Tax=Avrilella dinanensis TaxID=2008672 RepID=A0A2M9R321_9FLAO|nr:hypothetical protein [Avrilella dinanensis]PJR03264.1 hypothetical protein CDL10_01190 [Avrilella dinanensis]
MYKIILEAHSGIAYLALIALFVAAVNSFLGLASKRTFKSSDKRIGLFGLIFTHIQLLAGLILYFVSQKGFSMLTSGNAMGNSELRLTALEHPIINIIAIVLITIGWSKHKKQTTDKGKFKSFAIYYTIGLILVLSRIPWKTWLPGLFN